jgi:hypothetical protein
VNEFVVKLRKDDKENLGNKNYDQYYYARVIVTLDVTSVIIRILDEDRQNPPYRIENKTNFYITFQQNLILDKKNRKKNIVVSKTPGHLIILSFVF